MTPDSSQGFKKDLDKLEPTESLNPKIAEKNAQIRNVQQTIEGLGEEQREMLMEKQRQEDVVRLVSSAHVSHDLWASMMYVT